MGNPRLVGVQRNKEELNEVQSTATLKIKVVRLGVAEKKLEGTIMRSLYKCHAYLSEQGFPNLPAFPSQDNWEELTVHKFISDLKIAATQEKPNARSEFVLALRQFTIELCEAGEALYNVGLRFCQSSIHDILMWIQQKHFSDVIKNMLMQLGLVSLHNSSKDYASDYSGMSSSTARLADDMPAVDAMLKELNQVDWNQSSGVDRPMVIILVQRRRYAHQLTKLLSESRSIREKNISVTTLLGHGGRKDEANFKGMGVRQQERTLNSLRQRQHQVLVATSVAEEGVDLPACELVIQMDPPTSVRALVQVRGRARRKNSRLFTICRSEGQKSVVEDLLQREKFMIEAVERVMRQQGQ